MPKKQFILNYTGNKYIESKKYTIDIDYSKYTTVIEPFAGSFGFSRYLYEDLNLKNINYVFYDNDKELIDFFNFLKENDIDKFVNEYNDILKMYYEKYIYDSSPRRKILNGKDIRREVKTITDSNMKYLISKNIITSFYSFVIKNNLYWNDLIKKSEFIFSRFEDIDLSKYDKDKTLIYFDPPYLGSYNKDYKNVDLKNGLFEKIYDVFKIYDCILVHSYADKIDKLFKEYEKKSYKKIYGNTKNEITHKIYHSIK